MDATVHLLVPNLSQAIAFFSALEVFKVTDLSIPGVASRAEIELGVPRMAFRLELSEPTTDKARQIMGKQAIPDHCFAYFSIADLDAWHSRMRQKGVTVGPLQDFPWGAFAVVQDPFGNTFAFSQAG